MSKTKTIVRDVVAQGPSKSRRKRKVDGFLFPRAMLMLRQTARKTEAFPEHEHCSGVLALSQRIGGEEYLYRDTSSPGLTRTRRRSAGRQGAPSPRLVVMPRRRDRSCSQQQSQQAGRRRWSMHARTNK